eukprot:684222-Amphidinium_carterae.1
MSNWYKEDSNTCAHCMQLHHCTSTVPPCMALGQTTLTISRAHHMHMWREQARDCHTSSSHKAFPQGHGHEERSH